MKLFPLYPGIMFFHLIWFCNSNIVIYTAFLSLSLSITMFELQKHIKLKNTYIHIYVYTHIYAHASIYIYMKWNTKMKKKVYICVYKITGVIGSSSVCDYVYILCCY